MSHDNTNNIQTSKHIFTENNAQLYQYNGIPKKNKNEKIKEKKIERNRKEHIKHISGGTHALCLYIMADVL